MNSGQLTDPTCLFWGILPALAGVAAVGVSLYSLLRSGAWIHFFLTPISVGSALYGLTILYHIFRGAWPTYLAHFCILVAAGCAVIQMLFARGRSVRRAARVRE